MLLLILFATAHFDNKLVEEALAFAHLFDALEALVFAVFLRKIAKGRSAKANTAIECISENSTLEYILKHLLSMQMRRLHQTAEVISLLAHLVPLLAALLLGAVLNILFKYLFAFARRQQQIPGVKHDLV